MTLSNYTGFGKYVSWQDAEAPPLKHKMSFKRTLNIMSIDIIFKIIFPEKALCLTERLRGVRDAFHELQVGQCSLMFSSNFL